MFLKMRTEVVDTMDVQSQAWFSLDLIFEPRMDKHEAAQDHAFAWKLLLR